MIEFEYKTFKFKATSIVNNINTIDILKQYTSQLNKIIEAGTFLFNTCILYCLSNKLDIVLDSTMIRQCSMLFIDPNKKMGRIKQNFNKQPNYAEKSKNEIKELKTKFTKKCENIKNTGIANKKRLEIIQFVYHNCMPLDKIPDNTLTCKDTYSSAPIGKFADLWITLVQNHITYNYFKFQLKYLKFIIQSNFVELNKKQINTITYYVRKCININDDVEFYFNVKNPCIDKELFDQLKDRITNIINEQISHIPFDRPCSNDLNLKEVYYDYTKSSVYEKLLKNEFNCVIKYFYLMSSFLTLHEQKSFSIVPQYSLDLHNIQFDCRSLPAIYDDTFNETVNMADFENNFVKYFDKLFNLKKLRLRMQKRDFEPSIFFQMDFLFQLDLLKNVLFVKKN